MLKRQTGTVFGDIFACGAVKPRWLEKDDRMASRALQGDRLGIEGAGEDKRAIMP